MIVFTVIGVIATVFFLVCVGSHIGLQLAVDKTKRDGFFRIYGKKFKAVEVD